MNYITLKGILYVVVKNEKNSFNVNYGERLKDLQILDLLTI